MKALNRLAALLLSAASPLFGQSAPVPFESQVARIPPAALPGADELLDEVKDGAGARSLDTLDRISLRASSFTVAEQLRLVAGLRELALSPISPVETRWKALEALSRTAASFREAEPSRRAVAALGVIALPRSPAPELRRPALLALAEAMGRLPWLDRETEENIVLTSLESMGPATPEARSAALMLLGGFLEARGASVILKSPELGEKLSTRLLAPLEESPDAFFGGSGASIQDRRLLVRTVGLLARGEGALPSRARRLLSTLSSHESDPRLKGLADLQAKAGKP